MNDTTLTPTQQIRVAHAEQFLAAKDEGRAELAAHLDQPGTDSATFYAYALGAAAQHMRYLLKAIAELTGDDAS
jgi:hypothetical protein